METLPMRLPAIQGLIKRRILANFRVDPAVMARHLPAPLAPKLASGHAIAGVCLIRLEQVRPKMLPLAVGFASENAAHRVAVTWKDASGTTREGVYVCRRDTGSLMNRLAGGRLFPGEQNAAHFDVKDRDGTIDFAMRSDDGTVSIALEGKPAAALPETSVFESLAESSAFFEGGSAGYSVTSDPGRLDGLRLVTTQWKVEPLAISRIHSSWFADEARFPKGSVTFDHALLMRDIEHGWEALPDLAVTPQPAA